MNQDENQQGPKKSMPIPLVFLLVVGACLILVFNTTHIQYNQKSYIHPETVEAAIARKSLNAGAVITENDISTERRSKDELPKGDLVSPLQVIGRVLAVPIFKGQVFTKPFFGPEVTSALLSSQVPPGMRAVTISVPSKMIPDRASLYPGCSVDVVAEYKLPGRTQGEALSQTILRGIQVLAISGDTVISSTDEEDGTQRRDSRGTLVVLLVGPRQAEALSLAVENGGISLTVRNPLGGDELDGDPSILNKNRLTLRGSDLPSAALPSVEKQ
jgi:Flp pilus assembly protein CpaB